MGERPLDLGWIRMFCEVGRTGNLTLAAERLGLSQPAVSYQIRRIEEQLRVSLFERQHRGVALTADGRRLFDILSKSVDEVDVLVKSLRQRPSRPALRLRTDYAFSTLWLMPRVHAFRSRHPGADIQIVATHRDAGLVVEEGEVAVVFGTREEFGTSGSLLLPERVAPVCTPRFLAGHGPLATPAEIAGARLLHLDTLGSAPWYDWASYLRELGTRHDLSPDEGEFCFNTYALVIQAALADQGLAIGWLGLVDQLIDSGMLVVTGPELGAADRGYWLLPPSHPNEGTDQLCAWLSVAFAAA
ncbi:LysR family transcriptional regulator [Rhizobium sp. CSW-27]|uniref:choline sulfate utilization transcriptional regulator n=1 Tax=Rhizobium sp. CSW-27 TaxID=2839985 RepID=UPI001C030B81|nr:LysR family transcriptional regulator [Rhizobium sp. CSW-27]MBT9372171.1 LysR family transcriptional regulator [Rhizobium sp. CSW-27]